MHSVPSLNSVDTPAASLPLLRALDAHRQRVVAEGPQTIDTHLMTLWIHHDCMLEGRLFSQEEIHNALTEADENLDRYLHPLMQEIRRYRDAVNYVLSHASDGKRAIRVETLKAIHRLLTPKVKDRGGQYRLTSPVHRDYFQRICPADKVPYHLRKLFEQIRDECDEACDPIAFAAVVHHRLMHVYPFRRNPGTTARLFTNLLLLSCGHPPAIIPSSMRQEYYNALRQPEPTDLARIYSRVVAALLERWEQAAA